MTASPDVKPPFSHADVYAWVIEKIESEPSAPLYFEFVCEPYRPTGDILKGWAWNRDHMKAARFSRREDAELCWQAMTTRELDQVRIAEHGWDTRPANKEPQNG